MNRFCFIAGSIPEPIDGISQMRSPNVGSGTVNSGRLGDGFASPGRCRSPYPEDILQLAPTSPTHSGSNARPDEAISLSGA